MSLKSFLHGRVLGAGVLFLAAFGLSGCASTVYTKVNAFQAENAQFGQGTIAVRAGEAGLEESLEFAYYRDRLLSALAGVGYTPVGPGEVPDYEAFLSFDVEETTARDGRLRTGVIARGYPYPYGGYGYGSRLGVVLMDEQQENVFLRRLGLVIARADSGERIYEVKGISQGQCGVFSVVFDEMLQAVLKEFPAGNGAVKNIGVRGDARC